MATEIPVEGEGNGYKKSGGGEAERAAVRQVASLQLGDAAREAEARLNEKWLKECEEKLHDMDVGHDPPDPSRPPEFEFPYRENGKVLLAPGQMSQDEVNIGGNIYKINVRDLPIKLVAIGFPKRRGGKQTSTKMEGVAEMTGKVGFGPVAYVSADKAKVDTKELYAFLDELRRDEKKGTTRILKAVITESVTGIKKEIEVEFKPDF